MVLDLEQITVLMALECKLVFQGTKSVPIVHVCKFEDLEPLILLKVILRLQAQLYLMLWIMLGRQGQRDVTKSNEMFLFNQFYGLADIFSGEDIPQIVAEIGRCESNLHVRNLLILVNHVDFDSSLHEVPAVFEHFQLDLLLLHLHG